MDTPLGSHLVDMIIFSEVGGEGETIFNRLRLC